MALTFEGGWLRTATMYHTTPFTVGMWVRFPITGTNIAGTSLTGFPVAWAMSVSTTQDAIYLGMDAATGATLELNSSIFFSPASIVLTTPLTTGWNFVLVRCISNALFRLDALFSAGGIESGSNTSGHDITAVGYNMHTIGALSRQSVTQRNINANTAIAEWWMLKSDVQANTGAISPGLMRQLAYGGPFSVPHLANKVLEYHNLRLGLTGVRGSIVRPVSRWTRDVSVGTLRAAPHPPLPYWYRRLDQPLSQIGIV